MILACLSFVAFPVVVVLLLLLAPVILVAAVACAVAVAAVVSCDVAAVYRTGMRGMCKKIVFRCIVGQVWLLCLCSPVLRIGFWGMKSEAQPGDLVVHVVVPISNMHI